MRISDWSSDVCSSDLRPCKTKAGVRFPRHQRRWRDHARTRVLPGPVRPITSGHDRRRTLCAHDTGQARSIARRQGGAVMTQPIKVFLPGVSAAIAVDANNVARAIEQEAGRRGLAVRIVRNGSRGMLWLEPLVEIDTPQGRVAYGPVPAADVPGLFDSEWPRGGGNARGPGTPADTQLQQNQEHLTFAPVDNTHPH